MAGTSLSSFGAMAYPAAIADPTPPAGDKANAVVSGVFSAVGPGQALPLTGPCNFAIWASYNTTLTTTAASNAATVGAASTIAVGAAINSTLVPPGATVLTISGTNITMAFPTIRVGGVLQSNGQISGLNWTTGLLGSAVSGPGVPTGATVVQLLPNGVVQLSAAPTATTFLPGNQQQFNFALTANCVSGGADTAATFTGAGIVYSGTVQLERSFNGGQTWLVANIGGSGTLAQYSAGTPVNATFGEPEQGMLYRLNCASYASGTIQYRLSTTGGAAASLAINQLS